MRKQEKRGLFLLVNGILKAYCLCEVLVFWLWEVS